MMRSHWRVLSRVVDAGSSLLGLWRKAGRLQEWKYEKWLEDAFW